MYKSSQKFLSKAISRHPFQRSPIPMSHIPSKLIQSPNPNFHHQPTSNFHHFSSPTESTRWTQFQTSRKLHDSASKDFDQNKVVDEINMKFAEARDEIEMALESKETVYFDEEAETAKAAVKEVLDMFNDLLEKLSEKEKGVVQRSMGLKIEQLKAELEQLNE